MGKFDVAKKWVQKNAPTLMMSGGIACYGGATAFSIYGTVKSCHKVYDTQCDEERSLTTKEKVTMCWKFYIPAALCFAGGTALVVGANHMQLARIELLAGAYAATNGQLKKYKEKVKEVFGEDADDKVRHKTVEDMLNDTPLPPVGQIPGAGTMLCMDGPTGQYFYSTRHVIDKALTECDRQLMTDGEVCLNDLLYKLGCNESKIGNTCGWNTMHDAERNKGCFKTISESISFNYATGPNGEPVLVLTYEPRTFLPFL